MNKLDSETKPPSSTGTLQTTVEVTRESTTS